MITFEELLAEKSDEELKKIAARALENFIHWGTTGTDEQFALSEKIIVLVLDEIKRRRL